MTKRKPLSKKKTSKRVSAPLAKNTKISVQPGIYTTLKELLPSGIQLIGDTIQPGLGTVGSLVTKKAMDLFGKITGFGDYNISSNSLVTNPTGGPPSFGSTSNRIRGKEYVTTLQIPAGGQFKQLEKWFINPSNPKLFPKLSIQAQLYQSYKLHGMVLYFESLCSESVTTTDGKMSIPQVMAVTTYNLREKDLRNESEYLNSFFCSTKRVNKDFVHPIECDRSQSQVDILYTWANSPVEGFIRDPNLENHGLIQVATVGGSQTADFKGYRVYVEYDIEFMKPVFASQVKLNDHYMYEQPLIDGILTSGKLTNSSSSFGDLQKIYKLEGNVLTFEPGVYGNFLISLYAYYDTPQTCGWAMTASTELQDINIFRKGIESYIFSPQPDELSIVQYAIKVQGDGGTITFTAPTATDWSFGEMFIESLENLDN